MSSWLSSSFNQNQNQIPIQIQNQNQIMIVNDQNKIKYNVVDRKRGVLPNKTNRFLIYAGMDSPFSYKLRSYLAYKHIPYTWVIRDHKIITKLINEAGDPKPATLPYLHFPDGKILSDSTPLIMEIETSEVYKNKRSIVPKCKSLAFLAHLIEDFADELFSLVMFYYRWGFDESNAKYCAARISRSIVGTMSNAGIDENDKQIYLEREVAQADFIYKRQWSAMNDIYNLSSPDNSKVMKYLFESVLNILEDKILPRSFFIFGNRPTLADFGLFGMIYPLTVDPAPSHIMTSRFPRTFQWIQRMVDPSGLYHFDCNDNDDDDENDNENDYDKIGNLSVGAIELLKIVAQVYLPIGEERLRSFTSRSGFKQVQIIVNNNIGGITMNYSQPKVAKYSALAFRVLKEEFNNQLDEIDKANLKPILQQIGGWNQFALHHTNTSSSKL